MIPNWRPGDTAGGGEPRRGQGARVIPAACHCRPPARPLSGQERHCDPRSANRAGSGGALLARRRRWRLSSSTSHPAILEALLLAAPAPAGRADEKRSESGSAACCFRHGTASWRRRARGSPLLRTDYLCKLAARPKVSRVCASVRHIRRRASAGEQTSEQLLDGSTPGRLKRRLPFPKPPVIPQ